jgi:tetratricopeptide (TPR) repeat protein
VVEADLDAEDRAAVKGTGGRRALLVLATVVVVAAIAAAVYALGPFRRKPPAQEVAVPLTLQVAPAAPAPEPPPPPPPEPEPPPAPVAAPEPVEEKAPPPPEKVAPKPPAPKGPKALLAEASRLREKGQLAKALDLFGRVVDQDPENVAALVGRGLCYLDLSEYPPAEASFQSALQAAPGDPDALLGLAETYRWQGKKADAIRYYQQYLALHPDGEEASVARNAIEELRR